MGNTASSPISRVLAVAGRTLYCSKDEISTHVNIVEGIVEVLNVGEGDGLGDGEVDAAKAEEGTRMSKMRRV